MSYDPDPRRRAKGRRGRVPPQLRAWVFGRRGKRTHDPGRRRRRRYDPQRADHKPYRVGRRGGVYWSGARKRRYDPQRFARVRRYGRRIGGKLENFINRFGTPIGAGLAALVGIWTGIDTYQKAYGDKALEDYGKTIVGGTISIGQTRPAEIMHLFGNYDGWTPLNYLKYKFLGTHPTTGEYVGSAWVIPFWASLIGFIVSKLPLPIPLWAKIRRPLGKVATGALVVSTIGALALPGSPSPSRYQTSNPYNSPRTNYVYK